MEKNASPDLYLICEGESDKRLLGALIYRVLRAKHSSATVSIVAAGGKQAVPRLVHAMERRTSPDTMVGMVVDSDGDVEGTESLLSRDLDLRRYFVIIAHPTLESWFESASTPVRDALKQPKQLQTVIDRMDLDWIAQKHPEFGELLEMVARIKVGPIGASAANSAKNLPIRANSRH